MCIIPFNPSRVLNGFPPFVSEETEAKRVGRWAQCRTINNSGNGVQSKGSNPHDSSTGFGVIFAYLVICLKGGRKGGNLAETTK